MPDTEPHFHYWRTFLYSQWLFSPPYPTTLWAGKTVVVTGSNVGLGLEASRHFARLGAAKIILAARNTASAEKAKLSIEESTKCDPSVIECWPLDLCSYDSVKEFAVRCNKLPRLDCLLESAGISKFWLREPKLDQSHMAELDEIQITTNVVSTFLLALLVLPKLKETATRYNTQPHLTVVTSEVHHLTTIQERKAIQSGKHTSLLAALNDPEFAVMNDRYAVSKLLEVFFVRELAARLAAANCPVVVNCVNPGFCHSSLFRDWPPLIGWIGKIFMGARSTEVGSRTLVHAASAGPDSNGQYLSNCEIAMTADFVRSEEGRGVQKEVWKDIAGRLEGIQPGITKNI